jgi:hypothetical protein
LTKKTVASEGYHFLTPYTEPEIVDVEEREAAMFRHPSHRRRKPKLACAGYRTTCPDRGCERCLL